MKYSGIGGQAVIEGVMMRNKDQYAVAVRKPDGEIEIKKDACSDLRDQKKWANVPIIRGVVAFVESLKLGTTTLNYSASFVEEEEEQQEKSDEKAEGLFMTLVAVVAVIFAIGLFVIAPYLLSESLRRVIRLSALRGLLEGVIRVILFVLYVKLISCMQDIKRVFMYHGAEHKTINCIEHGLDLNVENVKKQTTVHKRCGTSFMLVVMFFSILFFMFITVGNMWLRMLLRIVLIPLIAGISYEFIRLMGMYDNKLTNILSKPGLWLQGLTTAEPDDSMIEVAIASVDAVFDWKTFVDEVQQEEQECTAHTAATQENPDKEQSQPTEDLQQEEGIEVLDLEETDEEEDEILEALDRYFEAPEQDAKEDK